MKLSSLLSPRKMMSHLPLRRLQRGNDLADGPGYRLMTLLMTCSIRLRHRSHCSLLFVFQLTKGATADTRMRVRGGVRIRLLQSGSNLIRGRRIRRNFSRTQWDRREKSVRRESQNFDSDFCDHVIMSSCNRALQCCSAEISHIHLRQALIESVFSRS